MKCEVCASEDLVGSKRAAGALHPQDEGGWLARLALMGACALVIVPLTLGASFWSAIEWGPIAGIGALSLGVVGLLMLVLVIDGYEGRGRQCRIRCRDCGHERRLPWV